MKKNILFCFLVLGTLAEAQTWVSKVFSYDSLINVKYGTATNFNGGLDTLQMNIYRPICSDASMRRPLVMVIHGGAFISGSRYDPNIIKLTRDFAKRGYVTATIEYRLGFVSDDNVWSCNFPNYNCAFATDTSEWQRAAFRSIQDGKGALRYLINRNGFYKIDTNNVFVAGESAGAFIALGIGYMDTIIEKPLMAGAIAAAPLPNSANLNCPYNAGKTFTGTSIARPDLGTVDGSIEPTTVKYKIKGVASFYGGVMGDIFKYAKSGTTAPALYLYHQPCDLVVPFNSGRVEAGFSWCLANCYNCFGIANTPVVFGGNSIKNLITSNTYPISVYNDLTTSSNPNSCLLGTWSCADQINNPCHEIDNYTVRSGNLATFFAGKITGSACLPMTISNNGLKSDLIQFSPNPFGRVLNVENKGNENLKFVLTDIYGRVVRIGELLPGKNNLSFNELISKGIYFMEVSNTLGENTFKLVYEGE